MSISAVDRVLIAHLNERIGRTYLHIVVPMMSSNKIVTTGKYDTGCPCHQRLAWVYDIGRVRKIFVAVRNPSD